MQQKEKNIQKLAEDFITAKNDKNFKVLFERLRPGILNHCYLILKDQELAEDAFLNTMSKIWLKIDQYNSERGNFSTWCCNIARYESLLLMKSRKRYYSHTDSELEFLSSKNTIGDIGVIDYRPTLADYLDSLIDITLGAGIAFELPMVRHE